MSPFRKIRGQRGRFRPAIEALEDRTVPTGNVTATINGGTLVINGDAANNFIKIQGNSRGTLDVVSLDANTIINNQPGMVTLTGFNGGVVINMGDGHDAVVIDSVNIRGKFVADMGNGDDMLAVTRCTIGQDADVQMGNGNDNLMFGSTTEKGTAYINVGTGDNQANLLGARFNRGSFIVAGVGNSSLGTQGTKFEKAPLVVNFKQNIGAALPRATDDASTVASGGTVSINVASNDIAAQGTINTASIVITSQPAHGTATVNGNGTVSYKNDGSSSSTDLFGYTINNSAGAVSNQALVGIAITGVAGPTVTVTTSAGATTKTSPIPFTATFSDDVTNFVQSDITVTNGTIASFTATSARTYTFSVTPTADGAVTVTVPASVAQNAAGLGNSASLATTVTFDTTNPTITINPLTTNSATPTITGTVNEAGSVVTVTVNNQTFNATVTGTTWSATVPTALPAATYSVTATATDPAGNSATANNGSGLIIDLTPPTYVITSSATSPTGLTSIPITVTFTENVNNFVASDIVVTNGTLGGFTVVDGKTYKATITPTASGAVTASIAAGVATDAAGNPNTAASAFSITFDSTIPGVLITSGATNPTKLTSIPITVTFTENVNNFIESDIVVGNGTLSGFLPVNGSTYTATITPTADGPVTVNIAANVAVDADNHGNSAATPFSITFDSTSPTATITTSATSPTKSTSIPITVTFSENVNNFIAADIAVTNGTLNSFNAVDGKTYTAVITPTAAGVVTANVIAGVATDTAGNTNTAATPLSITFDNTSPTVAITSSATSPTGLNPIPITVTFNENVSNFIATDIVVTNGTLGNFNASNGSTYTATITPTGNGVVTANVAAGVATDTAGNANTAAPAFSITFDSSILTVTINPLIAKTATPTLTGTVSQAGSTVGVTVNGQSINATVTGTTWSAAITTALAAGTYPVSVTATDPANHTATASNPTGLIIDLTVPTVAITSSVTSPTGSSSIPITVTFSENVNNFIATDIVLTNGTLSGFTAVNGSTYTAIITPIANGAVTAAIAAGVASDAAGNDNTAAPAFSITFDSALFTVAITPQTTKSTTPTLTGTVSQTGTTVAVTVNGQTLNATVNGTTWAVAITTALAAGTYPVSVTATDSANRTATASNPTGLIVDLTAPTVAITSTESSPTGSTSIPITVTFSENVDNFVSTDIAVTNGTLGTFTPTNGSTYTAIITPTANGAVTVNVAANVATDTAGNANTAAPAFSITFDNSAFAVMITPLTTNLATPTIAGTVSEAGSTVSVTVNGQTVNATVNGTTWSAVIPTALAEGTYPVSATATDPANHTATSTNPTGLIIDLTAPTVAITSTLTSPTGSSSIPITVTFSENVGNFLAGDIVVTNAALSGFMVVNGSTYKAILTPTSAGAVTAAIAAGVANDAAGNDNTAATTFSITFDTALLAVAITPLITNSGTPNIMGTVNQAGATVAVTVNGQTINATVTGTTWSAAITPALTAGTYPVSVTATNSTSDTATANNPTGLTIDQTAPTVAITSTETSPTASTSIPITVTFSEDVTAFVAADISVTNGTLGTLTPVNGKTYTSTITPTAAGAVTVNVSAGIATDAAGNVNTAAPTFSITFTTGSPTLAHALANVSNSAAAANTTILLPGTFTDDGITNSSVTFKTTKGTTPLDVNVELFDKDAPLTVANFFNYLDRYASNGGVLFHRLNIEDGLEVIQGGGYTFNDATNTFNGHIATDPPIRNEFSPDRLDVRGTISMAKTNDPDSATSEFFFNLDDANAQTLDADNAGGFVVFGKAVAAADLANLDSLAAVPIKNVNIFNQLPLVDGTTVDENNIERVTQVVVNHRDNDLSYTATSSDPSAVAVSLSGFQNNQLTLDYLAAGTSTITVTATDKDSHSTSTTFVVTVT